MTSRLDSLKRDLSDKFQDLQEPVKQKLDQYEALQVKHWTDRCKFLEASNAKYQKDAKNSRRRVNRMQTKQMRVTLQVRVFIISI